ncbi:hypothetical protein THIOM_004733 [Candidatus Thiomargarita nelsonii]|uniref:Uncharacterized protein n=1 Tax=Candidatus Thiomargarita nelsonii TaxID=1003181 RepID=A0A176RV37_9GAMM|nr:hypothetical protein THIOM_004733 [Candidatus Thiomargarita nelsonii]
MAGWVRKGVQEGVEEVQTTKNLEKKMIQKEQKAAGIKLALGKAELDAFRQKIGVLADDIHTIGVAKTDIPGMQNITFEGASPKVRKLAGLPDATPGPIKSPNSNPLFTRHAEEDLANQFVAAVEKLGLTQADIEGRTLLMHISNPTGVCNVCRQGIKNPNVKPGVLKQLSEKYPRLTIKVTVESGGVKGGTELLILNGKFVD